MVTSTVFDELQSLERLYLDRNDISHITNDAFAGLTNLTHLYLSNNHITMVTSTVFDELQSLELLSLDHNDISYIANDAFARLTNLEILYLFSNNITAINSTTFRGLQAVELLHLYFNEISYIEAYAFAGLNNLRDFLLYDNRITMVNSKVFGDIQSMEYLALGNNQISTIAKDAFEGLMNLESLSLAYNALTTLPEGVFQDLPQGIYIDFVGNRWNCDCSVRWLQPLLHSSSINTTRSHGSNESIICITPTVHNLKQLTDIPQLDLCPTTPLSGIISSVEGAVTSSTFSTLEKTKTSAVSGLHPTTDSKYLPDVSTPHSSDVSPLTNTATVISTDSQLADDDTKAAETAPPSLALLISMGVIGMLVIIIGILVAGMIGMSRRQEAVPRRRDHNIKGLSSYDEFIITTQPAKATGDQNDQNYYNSIDGEDAARVQSHHQPQSVSMTEFNNSERLQPRHSDQSNVLHEYATRIVSS